MALLTAIVAAFAHPTAREVQALCARLLLGLDGSDTVVQGQLRGCVLMHVPNVRLSDRARLDLERDAITSPDAFVADLVLGHQARIPPPADAWRDQPLTAWAAIATAARLPDGRAPLPPAEPDVLLTDRLRDLIALAQANEPHNGALWLAEARLWLRAGRPDRFIEALDAASRRPDWDAHAAEGFFAARDRLEQRGLPRLDATIPAIGLHMNVRGLTYAIAEHLEQRMLDVIHRGDRAELSALVALVNRLQGATWRSDPRSEGFGRVLLRSDPFEAMARALGDPSTSDVHWSSVLPLPEAEADAILDRYFAAPTDHETRSTWRSGAAAERAAWTAARARYERTPRDRRIEFMLLSTLGATIVMAALVATAALPPLWWAVRRYGRPDVPDPRRHAGFWIGTTLAALIVFALGARAHYVTLQPVGMGIRAVDRNPPSDTGPWLLPALTAVLVPTAAVWVRRQARPTRTTAKAFVVFATIYVVAVAATATLRGKIINEVSGEVMAASLR